MEGSCEVLLVLSKSGLDGNPGVSEAIVSLGRSGNTTAGSREGSLSFEGSFSLGSSGDNGVFELGIGSIAAGGSLGFSARGQMGGESCKFVRGLRRGEGVC